MMPLTTLLTLLALCYLVMMTIILSKASKNFTPKLRIVEFVTKGGDRSYQAQIKSSLFGFWWIVREHNIKDWCIEQGQEELKRVIDAIVADEKARVVSVKVIDHNVKD